MPVEFEVAADAEQLGSEDNVGGNEVGVIEHGGDALMESLAGHEGLIFV